MKKVLVSAFAAAMSATAFAGMGNVAITFSTPGPDMYSDGTTVLDGERYALVWSPKAFSGINSDATAVGDSVIAVSAPVATGGHCPEVLFQVDESYANAHYVGGTWNVVLLDTRKFKLDADGKPLLDGLGNRIVDTWGAKGFANGYGVIGDAVANVDSSQFGSLGDGLSAATGTPTDDTLPPVVKGISFDGDNVLVTITTTKPALKYALVSGSSPDKVDEEVAGADASSYGSESKDIVLIKKKTGGESSGAEFFKVRAR